MFKWVVVGVIMIGLIGCLIVFDWFVDEEELKICCILVIQNQVLLKVVWDYNLGDGVNGYYLCLCLVFVNDKVFVVECYGEVVVLVLDIGKVLWYKNFVIFFDEFFWDDIVCLWCSGVLVKLSVIVVGYNMLFVVFEDGLVCVLNVDIGEMIWEVIVVGEILVMLVMDEGILVLNIGVGILFGLDVKMGEQLWCSEIDVLLLSLCGILGLVVLNGGVLVGMLIGKLQVNIFNSGILVWEIVIMVLLGVIEFECIIDVDLMFVVFGINVYIVFYDGILVVFELCSGCILWKCEYGFYCDFVVSGNKIYVVDNCFIVYVLDCCNGVELWLQGGLK